MSDSERSESEESSSSSSSGEEESPTSVPLSTTYPLVLAIEHCALRGFGEAAFILTKTLKEEGKTDVENFPLLKELLNLNSLLGNLPDEETEGNLTMCLKRFLGAIPSSWDRSPSSQFAQIWTELKMFTVLSHFHKAKAATNKREEREHLRNSVEEIERLFGDYEDDYVVKQNSGGKTHALKKYKKEFLKIKHKLEEARKEKSIREKYVRNYPMQMVKEDVDEFVKPLQEGRPDSVLETVTNALLSRELDVGIPMTELFPPDVAQLEDRDFTRKEVEDAFLSSYSGEQWGGVVDLSNPAVRQFLANRSAQALSAQQQTVVQEPFPSPGMAAQYQPQMSYPVQNMGYGQSPQQFSWHAQQQMPPPMGIPQQPVPYEVYPEPMPRVVHDFSRSARFVREDPLEEALGKRSRALRYSMERDFEREEKPKKARKRRKSHKMELERPHKVEVEKPHKVEVEKPHKVEVEKTHKVEVEKPELPTLPKKKKLPKSLKEEEQESDDEYAPDNEDDSDEGSKKVRRRRRFTEAEESNLIAGVRKYGIGHWKKICEKYKFNNRRPVDLKDKWRNLKITPEELKAELGGNEEEEADKQEEEEEEEKKEKIPRRRKFSEKEEKKLCAGVHLFGVGHWKEICENYKFNNRTPIDLKDKWRNMKVTDEELKKIFEKEEVEDSEEESEEEQDDVEGEEVQEEEGEELLEQEEEEEEEEEEERKPATQAPLPEVEQSTDESDEE